MSNSKALIQKRARIVEQMREAAQAGTAARDAGDATRAAEQDAVFDKAEAEERELSKLIAREQRLEELEKEQVGRHMEDLDRRGQMPGGSKGSEYRDAFRTFFRDGHNQLTPEQRAILGKPEPESRAQSVGTTTAGGYLVPQDYMVELERGIKDYSGVMQVARMISTATGASLPWATSDATSRKAVLVAENATSTPTDFTIGQKQLDAYMYRDMAAVSLELMQDSAFDIGQFISESFAESFGRGLNEDFTVGTGTAEPNGVVVASTLGTTAASATAFTRTEMVTFMHTVDPGYRKSSKCGWMLNDTILAAIKKLSLGSGDASPLWQASMREGAPDRIEGFPYWINQDMSSALTTGQKIMLFGDFNKYIVRQVLGMNLRRLEERFIDSGQIGFIAFARYDGELINTAAIKHFKLA